MLEQIDHIFGYIVDFLAKILFAKPGDVLDAIFSFPFIVLVLLVGSIIFTFYFKFINIRGFKHSIDVVRGKYDNPNDIGQISHFQALTSALSATIGLGNIAGVAVAVTMGGPGAVFWMMFIAIFSMSAKFVSATLGQLYRKVNDDGSIHGGPMYYLSRGLKERKLPLLGKILGIVYAVFIIGGAFGGGNMFQANQSFELVANRFTFFQTETYYDEPNGYYDFGEEFIDDNKNGKWDEGEWYGDCANGQYDGPEKFLDLNEDGIWNVYHISDDFRNPYIVMDSIAGEEAQGYYYGLVKWNKKEQHNEYLEPFIDVNENGKWDDGERFNDVGNGKWNTGETFIDKPISTPQAAEKYTDLNGNGQYDGDLITSLDIAEISDWPCNKEYDKGEAFFDGVFDSYKYTEAAFLNGQYDDGEIFIDTCPELEEFIRMYNESGYWTFNDYDDYYQDLNRNNEYDYPEPYIDSNNNGFYDYEVYGEDLEGNGIYDEGEKFEDDNCNNIYDEDEKFYDELDGKIDYIDYNRLNIHYSIDGGNGIYDEGEEFTDIGNGKWDDRSMNAIWYGLILMVIVGLVIIGGISRIAKVTEKIVPLMVVTYVSASLWVIFTKIDKLPWVISTIFGEAFSPDALYGGFIGVLIIGVQRAVFSNEGGVGSASIAHSAAKTDEPVREGIVAMIGPFIDTIVICFMTASVILITSDINPSYQAAGSGINGASLTSDAFGSVISWFPWILAVVVFMFSYSTMISWYYYGDKGWKYLFGDGWSIRIYQTIYLGCIMLGTIASLENVITFSDLMILSCAVPNIIGCMFLLPKLKVKLNDYWKRYKAGSFKTYK